MNIGQRPLIFRAWDDATKEWLMDYGYGSLGGFSLFGEMMLMGEWATLLDQYMFERNGHKRADLIVTQWTGLFDKNDTKIYEGDVVKGCFTEEQVPDAMWLTLTKKEREQRFRLFIIETIFQPYEVTMPDDIEVIGNVYSTPDLLTNQGTKS